MDTINLPILIDRYGQEIRSGDFVQLLVSKNGYNKYSLFKIVFSPPQHRWGLKSLKGGDNHSYQEVNELSFYLTPRLAKDLINAPF